MSGIRDIAKKLTGTTGFRTAVADGDYNALEIMITDMATAVYYATAQRCGRTYGTYRRMDGFTPADIKRKIQETEPPTDVDYTLR